MTHPLIDRLTTDYAMPRLDDDAALAAWLDRPGVHCLFVPGDPARNLETTDAAVILPELRIAFQRAFDCAVVGDAIEAGLRERSGVLKTPSLIFWRDGRCLGGIPKVRDWSDYLARIPQIIGTETV
ncbi:hydrogenase accessory protein [Frigidibacter sp. MR17.14]|uniref:hydrogenase accessory protein n=1 Tax=Frigidibacter sp. MR17.14 TaxID=3126509 RepID=UPI003012D2B3